METPTRRSPLAIVTSYEPSSPGAPTIQDMPRAEHSLVAGLELWRVGGRRATGGFGLLNASTRVARSPVPPPRRVSRLCRTGTQLNALRGTALSSRRGLRYDP